MTIVTPSLVIGGGPAGAALATHLAQKSTPVTLLERSLEPHDKVCGEFISGEAALYLDDLGINLATLGAIKVNEIRFCARDQLVATRLPFPAFSLSRRVLDEALLERASASGVNVRRGRSVQSLYRAGGRWLAELADGEEIAAQDIFQATGKHDLRGWKRPPGQQGDLIAFKLHWRLTPEAQKALGSSVELSVFPGGYAGLEPVEAGITNLCLVVRRSQFMALGQKWPLLLKALRARCPIFDRRLNGAEPCWPRPLAIAFIPYGFVQTHAGGLWRLGDQAACIPSFSGDGISIALHSARLAAHYYLAGLGAEAFQRRFARDVADQVGRATLLSHMLVRPFGQTIAIAVARLVPQLLGAVARGTRVPERRVSAARDERMAQRS